MTVHTSKTLQNQQLFSYFSFHVLLKIQLYGGSNTMLITKTSQICMDLPPPRLPRPVHASTTSAFPNTPLRFISSLTNIGSDNMR